MKEFISQQTIAGEARMRRQVFKGAFLFVEGWSDFKFYCKFADETGCQIITAHSNFNVTESCRILEKEGFAGIVGIIDSDFDFLDGKAPDVSCVFQTDFHDCEGFMLSTNSFEIVLAEFASTEKLAAWKKCYTQDVRDHILHEATFVGALLWHSNLSSLNLCFSDLEVKEFVTDTDLRVNLDKFVNHVKNKTQGKAKQLDSCHLIEALKQRLMASNKKWHIVRGHDFIDILCFALRKTIGSLKALDATREQIERGLRLAYSEDEFSQTQLFKSILKWESVNKPYRILKVIGQKTL